MANLSECLILQEFRSSARPRIDSRTFGSLVYIVYTSNMVTARDGLNCSHEKNLVKSGLKWVSAWFWEILVYKI
jgi:hypothetical protein